MKTKDYIKKAECAIEGIKSKAFISLLIIVMLGFILRIYRLGFESLWNDEAFSVYVAGRGFWDIINTLSLDIHCPLHLILLRFFMYANTSEFMMRFPSVIFGTLTILLIFKVGKMLFNTPVGLLSAFLLSISPFHIWYSQEARMYALFVFLALLSFFFFYSAIIKKDKMSFVMFIISTILCIYTHNYAFFIIFVEIFIGLIVSLGDRKFAVRFIISVLAIMISYSLWIPIVFQQISYTPQFLTALSQANIFTVPRLFKAFSGFRREGWLLLPIFVYFMLYALFRMFKGDDDDRHKPPLFHVPSYLLSIYEFGTTKKKLLLLLLWIFIPLISIVIFHMPYSHRYVSFILPMYIILVSHGIIKFYNNGPYTTYNRKIVLVTILLIVIVNGATIFTMYDTNTKADWRSAADYLGQSIKDGDAIVIYPCYSFMPFNYYFKNHSTEVFIDETEAIANPHCTCVYMEDITVNISASDIKNVCINHSRVWFIYYEDIPIRNWLNQRGDIISETEFTGVNVSLWDVTY